MKKAWFWIGIFLVLGYGTFVRPVGLARGYAEDVCNHEMARQMMSENLRAGHGPSFTTDKIMATRGEPTNAVYFAGWNIERDWVGAYVFDWNRDFPFLWAYFLVSLTISYVGVGWISRKMGLGPLAAWSVAAAVVIFNLPRHFKLWHHSDNVMLHWVYVGFFFDAWIWQRFVREKKWSIAMELWRGVLALLVFTTMGYGWGPTVLEWGLVRAAMIVLAVFWRTRGIRVALGFDLKKAAVPFVLCLLIFETELRWFIPLLSEARKLGPIAQAPGWYATLDFFLRPLWMDLFTATPRIDTPETVVTIGWFYWIPVLVSLRRNFLISIPFLAFIVLGILYATGMTQVIQTVVPFMIFFRTASRFGLFLPPVCAIIVVLAWPELKAWVARRHRALIATAVALFTLSSAAELTWLLTPVNTFQPFPQHGIEMLERIRDTPGDTVLTFPFCVAGANGYCTQEQCPYYPTSTVGACTRIWHDKKVYGAYASRMNWGDCSVYQGAPFRGWFEAWRSHRCFNETEWDSVCSYLDGTPGLAALLVFPDLWVGANRAECQAEFARRLGPPIDEVRFSPYPSRGGTNRTLSRMQWYAPHCRKLEVSAQHGYQLER